MVVRIPLNAHVLTELKVNSRIVGHSDITPSLAGNVRFARDSGAIDHFLQADKFIGTDPDDQGFAFGGTTPASVRCVRDVVVDAIQTIVFLFIFPLLGRGYEYPRVKPYRFTAFTMDTSGSCYYRRFVGERTGNSELLSTLVKNAR
jgi:hypothetical protein